MSVLCIVLFKFSLISLVVGIINVQETRCVNETALEDKFDHKLYTLKMDILDELIAYIDGKVSSLTEQLAASEETMKQTYKSLAENMTRTWNVSLDASIQKLENKTIQRVYNMQTKVFQNQTSGTAQLPCKEVSLDGNNRGSPVYSLQSLNHAALRRDAAGRLAHLETRVGVQADENVAIMLMDKGSKKDSDIQYNIYIGYHSIQHMYLYKLISGTNPTSVIDFPTPDILSATHFRFFYVRIDNGTLQFGKEGDSTPLISHDDENFGAINYIQFYHDASSAIEICFDCPAAV